MAFMRTHLKRAKSSWYYLKTIYGTLSKFPTTFNLHMVDNLFMSQTSCSLPTEKCIFLWNFTWTIHHSCMMRITARELLLNYTL